ncbi:MAG: maleylpyruvate isomerase N-terminal domain-containing protein [Anaerolineaceae bacterium]|nr:maleylpyruvate isomerase N-terminal domain-containing protein [Anaerolineaceae bacterium]
MASNEKTNNQVVNTLSFAGKPVLLDVIRTESQAMFALINDPDIWDVQTRCTEWQTRDIVGHLIDTTEGYLNRWEKARKGEHTEMLSLPVMAEEVNKGAKSFRSLPRQQAIDRLKEDSIRMMAVLESLTENDWSNFIVEHRYMGPLPTFFYPAFQVMDYGVHTWDIRYGLGDKIGKLSERTAGVLVPYMFILMQSTVDATSAAGLDSVYGIQIAGPWGGKYRVTVKDSKFNYKPEEDDFKGYDAVFTFDDPSDFVLTSFLRFPGGSARGDPDVIDRVRHMFFRI